MPLSSGTKLGPYEILAPLGAGGMGEVYRARDTRLDRLVAIKVLPANLSADANLKLRLEREAKAVSKLSHPHICTLHDIGQQDGTDFLVMELLEGETLEQRLMKGPLPPDQVLLYGAQIADALAKAHKLGITHRDLKPSNVMLTKSGAKLMDFGLAKQSGIGTLSAALTEMTMEPSKLTSEGMLVGTFQYMAPEQLEGKEADPRTDIFALGELIHEMATGKPAFGGSSRATLIASILTAEPPPISQLQPLTPPGLERVVKKCLAKDPDTRWQSASDLASELRWIGESGSQAASTVPASSVKASRAPWVLAGIFFLLMLAAGLAWWKAGNSSSPAMYFNAAVPFPANDLALSPDQHILVMVAYSSQANDYVLWTYEIGGRRSTALEGTQGASYPFWSPDSRSIGFFADGKLKKIDAAGGRAEIVCDAPNGRGGAWNRDGVIVFAPDSLGGLFRVPAIGGTPVLISKTDPSRFESSHRWPVFLPDQKHFIYLAANFSGKPATNAIFEESLDSTDRHLVVASSANASYADPGYLLYLRDRTLVAQPFDPRSGSLSGQAHPLSDEVLFIPQVDRAAFSASSTQVLAIQTGTGAYLSQPTWFDRTGKNLGTVGPPGWYDNVRLSPDGHRIAIDRTDPDGRNIDVWVEDVERGTSTRLTFDPGLDQTPIWNPDSQRVLFGSNRIGSFSLYVKNADGSGSEQALVAFSDVLVNPWDWSRDSKYVLIRKGNGLEYLTLPAGTIVEMKEAKGTVRGAQFSPDAQWIAYASNETGTMEVYVSPFPGMNGKWQVSSNGGQEPKWRADGKELFYLSTDGKVVAVPISITGSFQAGTPVALFQTHRRQPMSSQDLFSYDVSSDGQKFLVATKLDEGRAAPLSVLLNWTSGMEK